VVKLQIAIGKYTVFFLICSFKNTKIITYVVKITLLTLQSPDYTGDIGEPGDISIIYLPETANLETDFITPICLPSDPNND